MRQERLAAGPSAGRVNRIRPLQIEVQLEFQIQPQLQPQHARRPRWRRRRPLPGFAVGCSPLRRGQSPPGWLAPRPRGPPGTRTAAPPAAATRRTQSPKCIQAHRHTRETSKAEAVCEPKGVAAAWCEGLVLMTHPTPSFSFLFLFQKGPHVVVPKPPGLARAQELVRLPAPHNDLG